MTTVPVFRSTERMSNVAETWPFRMANRKSLAARADAPSRTPSLSNVETLAVTSRLSVIAARPDPCPSAKMTDMPPPGRSTISTVSPLSRDAYLFVLATATSIFKDTASSRSLMLAAVGMVTAGFHRIDGGVVDQPDLADMSGDEQPGAVTQGLQRLERAAVERSEERRVGKECRSRWSPYH